MSKKIPIGTTLLIYKSETSVGKIAWHPDGRLMTANTLSRYTDGKPDPQLTVEVWDLYSGKQIQRYEGHISHAQNILRIRCLAWSPDRNLLASADDSGAMHVWRSFSGEKVSTIQWQKEAHASLEAVAWSPDGRFIAVGSGYQVGVYASVSGQQLLRFSEHQSKVVTIAWSPDGRFIASGTGAETGYPDRVEIRVWDPSSGQLVKHTTGGNGEWVSNLAWSPDGQLLAYSGDSSILAIKEALTDKTLALYQYPDGLVSTLAWSPDGRVIACAGGAFGTTASTVHIWEVTTKNIVHIYRGHQENAINNAARWSSIGSIAWSADGKQIASAGSFLNAKQESQTEIHVWQAGE